ncbi:MAG: endonuclease domain-containing protein [Ekhidna sp.]|nr:endonuclease domain-containing protein [Ekhidna sp.]
MWVCCRLGSGYQEEEGCASNRKRHFKPNSVGLQKSVDKHIAKVWLIGKDEVWFVPLSDIEEIEVLKTGDKYDEKICNKCHCLLPVSDFDQNQNNLHGIVRRPSCKLCRTDIDKRAPKSRQAKQFEKKRPKAGTLFKCPICQRRSIVGVTAKIVADHNHHTGDIRDFICDSCNTGLGKFRNGENYLKNALQYIQESG